MSRRMASDRAGLSLRLAAQASTLSRSSDERRMVIRASCPVAWLLLFFLPPDLPRETISFPSTPSSIDAAAIFNPANTAAVILYYRTNVLHRQVTRVWYTRLRRRALLVSVPITANS